uniref:Uncharacterized protein n=1 Tax=Knipowitschia caucasica TaxID=637954 RepID=A0AAV2L059_KNICA
MRGGNQAGAGSTCEDRNLTVHSLTFGKDPSDFRPSSGGATLSPRWRHSVNDEGEKPYQRAGSTNSNVQIQTKYKLLSQCTSKTPSSIQLR